MQFKVRAAATLTVTPSFDGLTFPASTVALNGMANQTSILRLSVPRSYKGSVPRVVVTSTSPFHPYWLQLTRRISGRATEHGTVRIPAGLGGEEKA